MEWPQFNNSKCIICFIIVLSVHIYLLFSEDTHSLLIFLNFIYLAHRNERGEYVFWSGGTFLFSSLLWGTCGGAPEGGAFPLLLESLYILSLAY